MWYDDVTRRHMRRPRAGRLGGYNHRFYRHVSFETALGLASGRQPRSYWEIIDRDNPRKGVATVRRQPRRRKTATGIRQDASSFSQRTRYRGYLSAQDIDEPGTTG
jgi:hypothetical protein